MDKQHQCPFISKQSWRKGLSSGHPGVHILSPGQNPLLSASNQCTGWLLGLGGAHLGEDLRLTDGEVHIGSGWDSDIVLTTPEVSRRHAKFTSAAGVILLEDNGSASGVSVNGEKILEPRVLAHADLIRFGVGEFLFFSAEPNLSAHSNAAQYLQVVGKNPAATLGWLNCLTGEFAGMDFRLVKGLNRFGSLPGLEVSLPDQNLNSIQMTIECSPDRFYLRPGYASLQIKRNGVFVDYPGNLRDSDIFKIGSLELRLRVIR
jgi:hypothetical protein